MRKTFDKQMIELHEKIVDMCSFVESSLKDCENALVNKDKDLASEIYKKDPLVDDMERDIEDLVSKIIIRQQPVATDLRKLTAALKIITDLERIGDQTQDISALILKMEDKPYKIQLVILSKMFREVTDMLKIAIDSYVVGDLDLAMKIKQRDDLIDECFLKVRNNCVNAIKEDSTYADQFVDLIQVGKYLERIGDHAANIAEWVVFVETGKHRDLN